MKAFRIDDWRVTEWFHVARQKEIKRLDVIAVPLSFIKLFQRPHHMRTRNRHATNCRLMVERWTLSVDSERFANNIEPCLRNPFTIFALGISGIQKVSQAVLRPVIVRAVDTL